MSKSSTYGKLNKITEWVRTLVQKYNYLPLAYKHNFSALFDKKKQLCWDIECIKKRAVEILTEDSDQAELYRQAIYRTLALHGFAHEQDIYVLGLLASRVMRKLTTIKDEVNTIRESIVSGKFRKKEYRLATSLTMYLVMLNYCYVLPHYTHDIIVQGTWQPLATRVKQIGATLQSLALIEKLPLYTVKESLLEQSEAEELVDFTISLRHYAVEIILNKRPKKVTELYALINAWIESELQRRRLPKAVRDFAPLGALVESMMVPYYLHHYGFITIDVESYLFFELKYL